MSDGSLFDLSAFGSPEPEQEPEEEQIEAPEEEPQSAPSMPMPGFESDPPAAMKTTEAPPASRQVAAAAPTALYRKYRPQTFDADEHFGQEHVVNTLRNAIALDRIAHAYLFCGPRGTGKTSTARILAKAVNCEHPDPNKRPCNECPSCIAINTGATTDVIEIDAASNRGIDDIRDLRERVKYAPTQLKTKFYIIDEAHQITGAAANAFLKTLEEPPAHTKFVLATTDPEDLLLTIISRCQRFDFRRISLDATVANLTKLAAAENIEIDDDAKMMIARHATGSLRDAQGLLDQVAVYRENADDESTTVTVDLVRTVLGVSRNDRVEDIANALADRDAGAGVRAVGDAVAAGDDVRQLARQLLTYMRELLLERSGGHSDLDAAGKQLAKKFDLAELAELTRIFGDIDFKVKHASIAQLPLEIAVVEGAIRGSRPVYQATQPPVQQAAETSAPPANQPHQEQAPPLKPAGSGNLIGRVQGGQRRQAPANQPPAQPVSQPQRQESRPAPQHSTPASTSAPASRAPEPSVSGDDSGVDAIRNSWGKIKADVHAENVRTGALLSEMDPVALEGNTVILTAPYTFHADKINSDETRIVVEQVISRVMGRPLTLECFTIDNFRQRVARKPQAAAPDPAPKPDPQPQPPQEPPSDSAPSIREVETASYTAPPIEKSVDEVESEAPAEPDRDPTESFRAVRNIFDAEEIDSPDR